MLPAWNLFALGLVSVRPRLMFIVSDSGRVFIGQRLFFSFKSLSEKPGEITQVLRRRRQQTVAEQA